MYVCRNFYFCQRPTENKMNEILLNKYSQFIEQMFRDRKYSPHGFERGIETKSMVGYFIANVEKVCCFFTPNCHSNHSGTFMLKQVGGRTKLKSKIPIRRNRFKLKPVKQSDRMKKSLHLDILKNIIQKSKLHKLNKVIIVADNLMYQARNLCRDHNIMHLSYQECEPDKRFLPQHVFQPKFQLIERLPPGEIATVQKFLSSDILIRYYGFEIGSFLKITGSDQDSGDCQDFGIVVENTD